MQQKAKARGSAEDRNKTNIFDMLGQLPQHGVVEELTHAAKRVRLRLFDLTVEIE